jgi:hypothetical protein
MLCPARDQFIVERVVVSNCILEVLWGDVKHLTLDVPELLSTGYNYGIEYSSEGITVL